ncbi:MAG: hypothetical protein H0W84_06780 [Bacteroidetes bacterium]|nr:hypothetical protein [Bacteroidota bacterium]
MKKNCLFFIFFLSFTLTKATILNKKGTDSAPKESIRTITFQKVPKTPSSLYSCFDGNSNVINIGIGFGGGDNYYKIAKDSTYSYIIDPVYNLTYEHGLPKKIGPGYLGLGIYFGYQTSRYRFTNSHFFDGNYYEQNWKHTMISIRTAYHWDVLNTMHTEVYIGGQVGVRIQNYSYSTNDTSSNKDAFKLDPKTYFPSCAIFIGARRYFTKNFSFFSEASYGISYITLGLNFKF